MHPLLEVNALEIKYHTRAGILTAIRDTSFAVREGEIVGIVGESGCGKSTVASAMMRLLPPNGIISGGQILFKGQDLVPLTQEQMRRKQGKELAMIFQDAMASLNPVFSVEQQLTDALRARQAKRRPSRASLRRQAIEMLDRVGIPDPEHQIGEYPHQFSGGMRQRIMIAMALLSNPALLVADEPTSALDVTLEAQIIDLIRGLRDELGTAILYITHDLGVVAQLCDRVLVMYAGSLVEAGDVHDIFARPQHPYTRALLQSHPAHSAREERLRTIPGRVPSLRELPPGCKFASRCDYVAARCHVKEPAYLPVNGQQVRCHAYDRGWEGALPAAQPLHQSVLGRTDATPAAPIADDEVVIETRALRTYFADHVAFLGQLLGRGESAVRALDGVDLVVRRGETLALVGESGSGKTTFGRTILRLEEPTGGQIILEGRDITSLPQQQIRPMRARMQMIFQDPAASLSPRMPVASLLLEPFRIHGVTVDEAQKVDELLEMVGLSAEQADKYPHQLSGGQARRVGIARALALNPDILVADEPTAGLDVSVAAGILNLLKDLRERLQLTYVIITHNLNEIGFIADRVAVMYLGKVVELSPTARLFSHPRHPYSAALMSAISIPDPGLRGRQERVVLTGEIPSPRHPPPGCPFHPRCTYAENQCTKEVPELRPIAGEESYAACFFSERVQPVFKSYREQ